MAALTPGALLAGRYRIESVIAQGGMGVVHRAMDERLRRTVAMKVLLPELAADVEAIKRFEREGIASARLSHPGIVQVFDYGITPDPSGRGSLCFIVMEHIDGISLGALLARGPLAPSRVIDLGEQALSALACAHAAGIVHRDLKPANLLLVTGPDGREQLKMVDFGLAQIKTGTVYTRLTSTGQILGTPLYMAPEQARGETCDARTDVYALGLVLWSCLTGAAPFQGTDMASVIVKVLEEVPTRADRVTTGVPAPLAACIEAAIQKSPAQRFASAAAFASALAAARSPAAPAQRPSFVLGATQPLGQAGTHLAAESLPSVVRPPTEQKSGRGAWLALAVVLFGGLIAVVAGAGLFFWGRATMAAPAPIERPEPIAVVAPPPPSAEPTLVPEPVPTATLEPAPTAAVDVPAPMHVRHATTGTTPTAPPTTPTTPTAPTAPATPEPSPAPSPGARLTSPSIERMCANAVRCCELGGAPHDLCQTTIDGHREGAPDPEMMCGAIIDGYRSSLEARDMSSPDCARP